MRTESIKHTRKKPMRMASLAVALFLAASALLMGGCSEAKSTIEDAINSAVGGASSSQDGGSSAASNFDNSEVEKHNAYIDLYNTLIDDIDKVAFDYEEEFGSDVEPQFSSGFDGFSMFSNSIKSMLDAAMPYADKAPPVPDADAALKDMAPLISEYATALDEAKAYYENGSFVDDDYAKAQGFHDIIIGKYEEVWEKAGAFIYAVDAMLDGQDEKEMARYESEGQMVHYYSLKSLVCAQEMVSYLSENDITVENVLDIKMDEFRPLYDAFAEAFNGYDGIVKNSSDAGKDEGIMSLMTFNRALYDVKSSSAALIAKFQSGDGFSSAQLNISHTVSGTPENIRRLVSDMLGAYNSWIVG